MATHPLIRLERECRDFRDPALYADCIAAFPEAAVLPPFSHEAKGFADLEDEQVWTRSWVFVGCAASIPNPGDLLSYTVGHHGIHLQRRPDGSIAARFNHAQHGGCRFVPLQCQTGKKTRCSYTACGHSRDRDVIPASPDGDDVPAMGQYLGSDPARLKRVAQGRIGPFLFVNLSPEPAALTEDLADLVAISERCADWPSARMLPSVSIEMHCNWKLAGKALLDRDATDAEAQVSVAWCMPNLMIEAGRLQTCAIRLQPTGPTSVVVTAYVLRCEDDAALDDEAIRLRMATRLQDAAAIAQAWQKALRATIDLPADLTTGPHADRPRPRETNAIAHRHQSALLERLLQAHVLHANQPLYSALGRALNAGVNA